MKRHDYSVITELGGPTGLTPLLPLTLKHENQSIGADGMLDTGASVNVLPYQMGLELGLDWQAQKTALNLTGNLANYEARGVFLTDVVGDFAPVRLAFAWTNAEAVPLLLGQANFFMEFEVCFYRAQKAFEVRPKN